MSTFSTCQTLALSPLYFLIFLFAGTKSSRFRSSSSNERPSRYSRLEHCEFHENISSCEKTPQASDNLLSEIPIKALNPVQSTLKVLDLSGNRIGTISDSQLNQVIRFYTTIS